MQKSVITILASILLVSSFVIAVGNAPFAIPPGYDRAASALDLAGNRIAYDGASGKVVERRIVYHHRANHNGGPSNNGGGDATSSCYDLFGNGVAWKVTEPYVLDTTNTEGMSDAFVRSATATSFATWDATVAFDVFGPENLGAVVDGADMASPDGKNEVFFGSIDSPGAIGVTIVWGVFSGPPFAREIIEYDTIFDQADYNWGDATIDPTVMDYQSIATHEFGHSAGLDDLYTADCIEATMYGYGAEGETYARTLAAGDIAGMNAIYS